MPIHFAEEEDWDGTVTSVETIPYVNQSGDPVECSVYENQNGSAELLYDATAQKDLIIEDFDYPDEDGYDLDDYYNFKRPSYWDIRSTNNLPGDYYLRLSASTSYDIYRGISSPHTSSEGDVDLESYPGPGSTFEFIISSTVTSSENGDHRFVYGAYDSDNCYIFEVRYEHDLMRVLKRSNGSTSSASDLVDGLGLDLSEDHLVRIDYNTGDTTIDLYEWRGEDDTTHIDTLTTTDSEHDYSGFGFEVHAQGYANDYVWSQIEYSD